MSEIVENTEEKIEEVKPAKKEKGFGTGLGIGLAVGALVLVIAMVTEGIVITRSMSYKGEVLDSETFQKMELIENAINTYFYDYTPDDGEVTVQDIRVGVLDGMLDALNDPYADYYTPEELKEVLMDNQGIRYGIGVYMMLDKDSGYGILSEIMEGSPAEAAGLREGDIIYEVDGEATFGLSLDEIVSRVKGEEGTTVHLTIIRQSTEETLEVDVTRGHKIETVTVHHVMLDDQIGYIQLRAFEGVTADQFTEALVELKGQGARGLIMDLRSNPGGLVSTALSIGEQILPEGLIVYEEYANGERIEHYCDGRNELDIPLVVLVNEYSASASEIITGAVRDYGIGTIVGKKTYGKGIVQDSKVFSDGSAVKLTVAAYYSPKGINIQGTGIEPDVEAEFDVDKYYDEGIDTQLDKAIDVIKSKMGQ